MNIPRDKEARRYYRAALQRLDDGKLILERLQRPLAAVYLAGYAVECILKALLLSRVASDQRRQVQTSFRGRQGHDLEWLRKQLKDRGVITPAAVSRRVTYIVTNWSTDLRYAPTPGEQGKAEIFIDSTEVIVTWAAERI